MPIDKSTVQFVELLLAVATRPKELLEVKRAHHRRFLVSHADRFDALELDAQKRSAADDIVFAQLRERLEARCDFREVLDFIEEDQCSPFNEPEVRLDERDVANDVLGRVAITNYGLVLGLKGKVDFYERRVSTLGKMTDALGLADLTGSLDNQRQAVWIRFPGLKERFEFPF